MTTIEYLGHSGISVEHQGQTLLCDPWMSPHGAYNASWFPYPEYPHKDLSHLQQPTAVYISHEHLDHFDPWFLDQLDRRIPILTGRVHKKRLLRKLRKLGFEEIVELDGFESYSIADDFVVEIATPTFNCPPHWFDSCAMIRAGEHKIFNLNDANLALPVDRIREEKVDILLGQASPAIWYPLVYTTYDEERHEQLKAARRTSAVQSFLGAAKAIRPRVAIPFAGPPIFFDEDLCDHFIGENSMFPTPAVSAGILEEQTGVPSLLLNPGDRVDVDSMSPDNATPEVERAAAYRSFDYERDRVAYFEDHRKDKQKIVAEVLAAIPEADQGLFTRFRRHFLPFLKGHPYFVDKINLRVLFDVTGPHGGRWVVDFRTDPKPELVYEDDGEPCQYFLRFESRNLEQVLRDELSWEDLLLSLRFRAHRDPDVYNQHLFTLFKMCDSRALNAIRDAEIAVSQGRPAQTFRLVHEGQSYEVQRYCPHGGSDLIEAEVLDGHLVCPGHHWRFGLEDGVCVNADCKIFIEPIEPMPILPRPAHDQRK